MATETAPVNLLNQFSEKSLEEKLKTKQAQIGVIGMGYVGLPLALLFSSENFLVTGFDIDANKVQNLRSGASYIASIPAYDIAESLERGFSATSDFAAISQMDAIIICVP